MESIHVIYEDPRFVVLAKPAGILTHRVRTTDHLPLTTEHGKSENTVADWVVKRYPEVGEVGDDILLRPGIVHRLDRQTSGVLVVARMQEFFEYLKKQFQAHEVQKTYIALVYGKVVQRKGSVDAPISLKMGSTKRTVRGGAMTKEAVTEYQVINYFVRKAHDTNMRMPARPAGGGTNETNDNEYFTLLEVYPKTGRTHQIRVHMASLGNPVVGDALYTKRKDPFQLGRHFLHAASLEFRTPDGKRMRVEAELPKELQDVLDSLKLVS